MRMHHQSSGHPEVSRSDKSLSLGMTRRHEDSQSKCQLNTKCSMRIVNAEETQNTNW